VEEEPDVAAQPATRPGPRYDNTLRLLLYRRSDTLAEFITGKPASEFVGSRYGETELPGTTLSVDALIETATQRLHVEIQTRANTAEFEPRLAEYAARLNRKGLPLEHHVLVLNPQGGRLSGTYRRGGLTLEYQAHHLWDYPADELLAHPILYPLAVLGSATSEEHRVEILQAIIKQAGANNTTTAERSQTIDISTTLAAIHLPTSRINTILERTNTMTTSLYEIYEDAVKDRYLEQGLEQGREEGRKQGLEVVLTLAELRLGTLPANVSEALSELEHSLTNSESC
jgi:predicted transposase YdaD